MPHPPCATGAASDSLSHCATPLLCTSTHSSSSGASGCRVIQDSIRSRSDSGWLPWTTMKPGGKGVRVVIDQLLFDVVLAWMFADG